jgi:hypothetical protein
MINPTDLKKLFNKNYFRISQFNTFDRIINTNKKNLLVFVLDTKSYNEVIDLANNKHNFIFRKNCIIDNNNQLYKKLYISESLIRQKIRQNTLNYILN